MLNNHLRVFENSFSAASSPSFFFPSPTHRQARSAILKALQDGEGLLVLSGEPGTGKTTTLKQVIRSLSLHTRPVFVQKRGELKNIPDFICDDLGLDLQREITSSKDSVELGYFLDNIKKVKTDELLAFVNRNLVLQTATVSEQLGVISDFLAAEHQENRNVVLLIDNGDGLKLSSLDSLLELTVNAGELKKSLQMLIAGSPFLARRLKKRYGNAVALHCELTNLTNSYVGPFIRKMMTVRGFKTKNTFSRPAVSRIARISKGNPSRINAICSASLLNANLSGDSRITAEIVEANAAGLRRLYSARGRGLDNVSAIEGTDVSPEAPRKTNKPDKNRRSALDLKFANNEVDLPFDPLNRFESVDSKPRADSRATKNAPESPGETLPVAGKIKIRISRKRSRQSEVIEATGKITEKVVPTNSAGAFIRSPKGYLPAIFGSTLVLGLIFYFHGNPFPQREGLLRSHALPVVSGPPVQKPIPYAKVIDSDHMNQITVQKENLSRNLGTISPNLSESDRQVTLTRVVLDAKDLALVKRRGLAERMIGVYDSGRFVPVSSTVRSIRESQALADEKYPPVSQERLTNTADNPEKGG